MKKITLYLIILLLAIGCSNQNKSVLPEKNCVVNFDSLLNVIDTSKIEIDKFSPSDSIEVRDKSVIKGEGSVFHFDQSGRLGLYAFMYNSPYSGFMISFDSSGKKHRLQEDEVVQWRYAPLKSDSILNITVLLCTVDRNYGDLALSAGSFYDSTIQLHNSTFTKIVFVKSKIPLKAISKNSFIYLRGLRAEKCTGEKSTFVDSLAIKDL